MEKVLIGIIRSEHNIKLKKALLGKILDNGKKQLNDFDLKSYLNMIEAYLIDDLRERQEQPQTPSFSGLSANEEFNLNLYDIIKHSIDLLLAAPSTQVKMQYEFYNYLNEAHLNELLLVGLSDENSDERRNNVLNEDNFGYFLLWLRINVELLIDKKHLTYDLMRNLIDKLNFYLNKTQLMNKSIKLCVEYMKLIDLMLPILKKLTIINETDADGHCTRPNSHVHLLHSISSTFVHFIAYYKQPAPAQPSFDLRYFLSLLDQILAIVNSILSTNCYKQLFKLFMAELIEILVRGDELSPPPPPNVFLSHLFTIINLNDAHEYIKEYFLSKIKLDQTNANENLIEINDFHDQKQIFTMLSNFISFLSWPFYASADIWIIGFMRLLAYLNKYTILIEICDTKLEYVSDWTGGSSWRWSVYFDFDLLIILFSDY